MDWFVVLAPVLLFPIVYLLAFVGCGVAGEGGIPEVIERLVILQWGVLVPNIESIEFRCEVVSGAFQSTSDTAIASGPLFAQPGSWSVPVKVMNNDAETFSCRLPCTIRFDDGHTDEATANSKPFTLEAFQWLFILTVLVDSTGEPQFTTG